MKQRVFLTGMAVICACTLVLQAQRVACVGDSITTFSGSFSQNRQGLSDIGISKASPVGQALSLKERLGKQLFFDKNLSTPIGQACADCHAPETGFANPNAK
jgi:cytochrome c peroxidase